MAYKRPEPQPLPTQPIWSQQPGENNRWFNRFELYRLAGPNRSMLDAYNEEHRRKAEKAGKVYKRKTSMASNFYEKAREWQWEKRAQAWDNHVLEQQRAKDAEARGKALEQVHKLRRTTIEALQAMLGQVITAEQKAVKQTGEPSIDPKTLKELAQAASIIFKESRIEFGEPTEYTDITSAREKLSPSPMVFVEFFKKADETRQIRAGEGEDV